MPSKFCEEIAEYFYDLWNLSNIKLQDGSVVILWLFFFYLQIHELSEVLNDKISRLIVIFIRHFSDRNKKSLN